MEILSDKLRPTSMNDIIGQKHLVGENMIIANLINNKKFFSTIFYGKPGVGKTSFANVIVNELGKPYKFMNAVINNKADFDIAIKEARMHGELILIIDEIHRMNKDKQDILLPLLESGLIILIGLTTSNPYHKINPAIRSRCHIFELKDLTVDDVILGINKAISTIEDVNIDEDTINFIANLSNGDLRYAYNLLELAYYSKSSKVIDIELIKKINSKPVIHSDYNETSHYDLLSALQKSLRGSDVDASLHYLARLLVIEDFDSLNRRLAVICYEDIGMANPGIASKLETAINFANLVGMPESRIIYGQIVTEMALSPKSNSSYNAINTALNDVLKGLTGDIPDNIKFTNTTYKYPHDYPNSYVKQNYMPDKLLNRKYYFPKDNLMENNLNKIYKQMKGEKK
ncbi:MAG: replication-associated recombination protein A [bacterium]